MLHRARAFDRRLQKAKAVAAPEGFPWYPYDSLANVKLLTKLLTGDNRRLLRLVPSGIVADVGAADGDLAFFLESLGLQVDIIDYPRYNFNQLEGVRRLAKHLRSLVSVIEVDLDENFALPRERYDLVFFLGLLYHLKNPYAAMEKLSQKARHVVLSTRVARFAEGVAIDRVPVAYLLAPFEANNDSTNYWIFSTKGLRRLFDRCGWDVLDWTHFGETRQSNPVDPNHDERVFCLLRSRVWDR